VFTILKACARRSWLTAIVGRLEVEDDLLLVFKESVTIYRWLYRIQNQTERSLLFLEPAQAGAFHIPKKPMSFPLSIEISLIFFSGWKRKRRIRQQ
jgi:hypothetical protein